jgi:chromate transporter
MNAITLQVGDWLSLFAHYASLSLMCVGGAITTAPDMHRFLVQEHGWLTDPQFSASIAIAQAAPGPNVLFVRLIGYQVSGITGALLATFFMCGPACAVAFCIAQIFHRFREKKWRIAVQAGLVPMSIGLIASVALIIARSADHDWKTMLITAATFGLTYWTRISPIYALAAATGLGVAGLL